MYNNIFKDERGSAVIIELAVVLVIMVMLFYGFTMFTNSLSISLAIRTAAREGAREYATSHNANMGVERARLELELSKMGDATINSFTDGDARGIEVRKKYPFYIPFSGSQDLEMKAYGIFVEEPLP